jgi:FkbM family methyltransferase
MGFDMGVPISFRLAHFMIRHNIRGGYRLLALMQPRWRNLTVDYKLSPAIDFSVPIGRPDTSWDIHTLRDYEHEFVSAFSEAIRPLQEITLFDCGADIGLFSASICTRSVQIVKVIAFEPNIEVRDVLLRNLSRLPGGEVFSAAVGDFSGFGQLLHPDYDPISDHARYIAKAESGFPVISIDSLGIRGGDVAIKVDVEGEELAVLRGASETIRSARASVVAFEANPDVIKRTGIHPNACLKLLEELAPFHFMVAETGESLTVESANFSNGRIVNVIGTTITPN